MIGSIGVLIEERKLGAVARVTVQNSAKLNTLNSHLMLDLVTELEALAKRDDLRAVVLTGAVARTRVACDVDAVGRRHHLAGQVLLLSEDARVHDSDAHARAR